MGLEFKRIEVKCPHCGFKQSVLIEGYGICTTYCDGMMGGCDELFAYEITDVKATYKTYILKEEHESEIKCTL